MCIRDSIYDKNTKLKEESFVHSQKVLESRVQKQLEECSFQPEINPLSSLIATKLRELDESSILNRTGTHDKQMLKIKEYLLQKEREEMEQCTFKPQIINKLSKLSQGGSSRAREVTNRLSRKDLNSAKERRVEP